MAKKKFEDYTEPELKDRMSGAMRFLENHLPGADGPGGKPLVILLTGSFGAGIAQYVANCTRENIVKFLRETADIFEAREDVTR